MEKKHTPTPWLISGTDSRIIVCKSGYALCNTGGSVMLKVDEDKANAEFIVEACNNYERLQSENERMRELLKENLETAKEVRNALAVGDNVHALKITYDMRTKLNNVLNPK